MNSMSKMLARASVYAVEAKREEKGMRIGTVVASHSYKRDKATGLYRREDGAWFRYDPIAEGNTCGMVAVTVAGDGSVADIMSARDYDGMTISVISAQVRASRIGKDVRNIRAERREKSIAKQNARRKAKKMFQARVKCDGVVVVESRKTYQNWIEAREAGEKIGKRYHGEVLIEAVAKVS